MQSANVLVKNNYDDRTINVVISDVVNTLDIKAAKLTILALKDAVSRFENPLSQMTNLEVYPKYPRCIPKKVSIHKEYSTITLDTAQIHAIVKGIMQSNGCKHTKIYTSNIKRKGSHNINGKRIKYYGIHRMNRFALKYHELYEALNAGLSQYGLIMQKVGMSPTSYLPSYEVHRLEV